METRLRKKISDGRTFEQIENHYQVETAIATRLKKAKSTYERKMIYRTMYSELFERVPDHPRLQPSKSEADAEISNRSKLRLVRKFLTKSSTFVEFGPGDCKFVTYVSDRVNFAYGVDISDQRSERDNGLNNFELIIYDGYDLNMNDDSADVVFSDQLIEHFHPDDTYFHFRLVRRILKPGGVYIFRMPHRFTGPHDISGYFLDHPEGFHLREWTYIEIAELLKSVEYSNWWGCWCPRAICLRLPFVYFRISERVLRICPRRIREILSRAMLPNLTMVAVK